MHSLQYHLMWSRSYYAGTTGQVSDEVVRRYIEAQKGV